eukprot:2303301-Amphidinium_carterae.2
MASCILGCCGDIGWSAELVGARMVLDRSCEPSNDTVILMKRAKACVQVSTNKEVLMPRNGSSGFNEVPAELVMLSLRGIADGCVTTTHVQDRSGYRQLREQQSWMWELYLENAGRRGVNAVVCAEVYRFLYVEACLLDCQYIELEVDHSGGECVEGSNAECCGILKGCGIRVGVAGRCWDSWRSVTVDGGVVEALSIVVLVVDVVS